MARRHRRTLPGIPAGKPGHPPQGGCPEFAAFCTRNPKPCPLIEITPPGDPEPARSAPGADLRTDVGGYRVYRNGELIEQRKEIRDLWRDDLVAFLLGCSHTFDHALIEAGVGVRNVECNTTVSMFITNVACRPAGRFHGPIVMTMRPIPKGKSSWFVSCRDAIRMLTVRPSMSAAQKRSALPILAHPTYGDPVEIHEGEVPVFWACGVTPQAVALESRPEFMITHEPGIMFLTDLPREGG